MPTQAALQATRPVKRSFTIAGHRTSISLESAFWDVLKAAAEEEGLTLAGLVGRIDSARGAAGLSGAVRVWVLDYALRRARVSAPEGLPRATGAATPRT